MGVQVLVTDPEELEKIRDRESDITKERIQKKPHWYFVRNLRHDNMTASAQIAAVKQ